MVIPPKIIKITTSESAINLVGKILGHRSNIDLVREWVFPRWKTKGRFDIVAIPNGFFLIKLMCEGLWMFGQRAMFIRRWDTNFDPKSQTITYVPI